MSRKFVFIIPVLLLLSLAGFRLFWSGPGRIPAGFNSLLNYTQVIDFYNKLDNMDFSGLYRSVRTSYYHAPLAHLITAAVLRITARDYVNTTLIVNLVSRF